MDLHTIIFEKYRALNKIHGVMFEVTHRCPCDCAHCFLAKNSGDELSLDEITGLFAQLKNEGTINIGLSGGEPFLRNDLPGILAAARKQNFFISLLTTGVLVGPAEARLLRTMHVFSVELSLLGAAPDTHDAVMKRPGAFASMLKAVDSLKAEGITVSLKSIIMKTNYRECDAMAALCRKLDVMYKANLYVAPRMDGDTAPQDLMLSADEMAGLNPRYITGGMIPGEDMKGGAILACNAGKNSAGISPQGDIYPCILMREPLGSIRERTIREIWHDRPVPFLDGLRKLKPEDVGECAACELKPHCRRCPGVAFHETGSLVKPSPSACRCAQGIAECSRRHIL